MACSSSSRARGCLVVFFLIAGSAGVTACGHLGIDLLGAAEEGTSVEPDASISADASLDARPEPTIDASIDAGNPAADDRCEGPNCSGTYVSGDTGDDTYPGTGEKPVKTIAKGIEIAKKLGIPTKVRIAARAGGAKYTEKISVVEGVSLIGGYGCTANECKWNSGVNDPPTVISNVDYVGVVAGETITRATVLESLWILGTGSTPEVAPGAVGLTIDGGAPTVRRCRIEGPNVTGGKGNTRRSIGVAILGPPPAKEPLGPLLEGNTVRSGASTDDSFAILLATRESAALGTAAAATIVKGNNIRSGQGQASAGIVGWQTASSTLVEGNSISGGTSTGGPFGSWAIVVSKGMKVERNVINGEANAAGTNGPRCTGDVFCGGIRSDTSSAVIRSNIIRGARAPLATAVLLGVVDGVAGSVILNGNTLDPVGENGESPEVSSAVVLRNTTPNDAVVGNVRNNILLGGTNYFRYGVYEEKNTEKSVHLAVLDNNDFWNPTREKVDGDFAYRSWDGATMKDLAFVDLANFTTPVPHSNLSKDPLLDGTFHLKSGSPMVDKGTPDEAATHDIDGDSRSKGNAIDLGADESK